MTQHAHVHHWRRKQQPVPVILPGKFHGQRNLVGCSPWGLVSALTLGRRCPQAGPSCPRPHPWSPLHFSGSRRPGAGMQPALTGSWGSASPAIQVGPAPPRAPPPAPPIPAPSASPLRCLRAQKTSLMVTSRDRPGLRPLSPHSAHAGARTRESGHESAGECWHRAC